MPQIEQVVLREHVRAHHSGPDPKCHGSMTPYLCKVCGDSYSTSEEIVAHIVQHCDDNTALRRQPQVGPRKYKRRRKLKPHEPNNVVLPAVRTTMNENYNALEPVSDSDDNTKRKLGRKNKQRSNVEEGYQNVLKSFESSLQNINSIVSNTKLKPSKSKLGKKNLRKGAAAEDKKQETQTSGQPGRPKMIHTQKTRVPVEMGGDGVKKGQKTKTMVTRTPKVMPHEHKSGIFPGGERNRPRTKNVSYHVDGRLQLSPGTFPRATKEDSVIVAKSSRKSANSQANNNGSFAQAGEKSEQIAVSPKKRGSPAKKVKRQQRHVTIKQEPIEIQEQEEEEEEIRDNNNSEMLLHSQNFDDGIVEHDGVYHEENVTEESILPDLDDGHHRQEMCERINSGKMKLSVKVEAAAVQRVIIEPRGVTVTPGEDVPETIIPDTLEYTCEMCSAVFGSRAELLIHVPIHI